MAKERILIVEDEKLIRWSIRSQLKEQGYAVEEAEDGKQAFAQASGVDPAEPVGAHGDPERE